MRRFTTGVASGLCGPTTVWPGRSPQGITNNKRIRSVLVCAALSSSVGVAAQTLALSAEPPCRLKLVCVRRGSADLGAALLFVDAVDLRLVLLLHRVTDELVLRACGNRAHSLGNQAAIGGVRLQPQLHAAASTLAAVLSIAVWLTNSSVVRGNDAAAATRAVAIIQ